MKTRYLWLIFLLCLSVIPVQAQDTFPAPPPGFFDALSDLGVRVGKSFSISCSNPSDGTSCRASDPLIQDWEWSFEVYPDTGIGCPQAFPGGVTATPTRAYRYMILYNGVEYEYRQNADRTGLFLCTQNGREEAFQGVTNAAVQCPTIPRLIVGQPARVTDENGVPNNIRDGAGRSNNKIGEIPAGAMFTVMGGPTCTADLVWWQINYNGVVGWTAEGDAEDYFVEPIRPLSYPTAQAVTPLNAAQLVQLGSQNLTFAPLSMDYAPLLDYMAFARPDGVGLYSAAAPISVPGQTGFNITLVEFNPNATMIAAAEYNSSTDVSQVRVWTINPGNPAPTFTIKWVMPNPGRLAGDLEFSPNGQRLAVSNSNGTNNIVQIYDVANGSTLSTLTHTGYPHALSFNTDGTRLAVATTDAKIHIWDMSSFTEVQTLTGINPNNVTGGQHHVVYHPVLPQLAYGGNANQIQLWDTTTGTVSRTLNLPDNGYTPYDLAYISSGNVLFVTAGIEILGQGKLYAFDPATGTLLFSTPIYSLMIDAASNNLLHVIDSSTNTWSVWGVP